MNRLALFGVLAITNLAQAQPVLPQKPVYCTTPILKEMTRKIGASPIEVILLMRYFPLAQRSIVTMRYYTLPTKQNTPRFIFCIERGHRPEATNVQISSDKNLTFTITHSLPDESIRTFSVRFLLKDGFYFTEHLNFEIPDGGYGTILTHTRKDPCLLWYFSHTRAQREPLSNCPTLKAGQ